MIQSATVFTYELDDLDLALDEIQAQLREAFVLRANTIGILMSDPKFIEHGVYQHLCEHLPFPIVGATSISQAVNAEGGSQMLTMLVMTSDDVFFSTGMTAPIEVSGSNILDAVGAAYSEAADKLPDTPKLAMIFSPLILENSGDQYVDAFTSLNPNLPVFGTIAIDDTIEYESCYTLCNGASSLTALSFILLSGEVAPRFLIATIIDDNLIPHTGKITRSEGNIVYEINNRRTSDYFATLGMAKDGMLDEGIQFIPFLLDLKQRNDYDGVPVVRAMVQLDENGFGICRGHMDQNSVFTLANPRHCDVLNKSEELIDQLNQMPDKQVAIIFSCMVRQMALGAEPMEEIKLVMNKLIPGTPFMMAYAGGEICPTSVRADRISNRFHNFSMIACIL